MENKRKSIVGLGRKKEQKNETKSLRVTDKTGFDTAKIKLKRQWPDWSDVIWRRRLNCSGLILSFFSLLLNTDYPRDRSDRGSEFYHLEQDEKEQLIEEDDDVVHFSANQGGFQIDSFKDNLEYHLGTIKSSLG